MEHELAKRMAESVARQGHIPRDKISIYQYGFELFISAICSILLVLVIGVAFGHPEYTLIYLIGFIPIRVCAGGYHGRTHLECYMVFATAFTICIILSSALASVQIFPVITCSFLLLLMTCLAPVEAKNKPLTPERRKRNHKSAVILSAADLLIAVILFCMEFEFGALASMYYMSKWTVILFTIWPVVCESLQKLTYVER